jgi:hypothetical protein
VPRFEPKNPDFRTVATATFAAQEAMHALGILIARLEPGERQRSWDRSSFALTES